MTSSYKVGDRRLVRVLSVEPAARGVTRIELQAIEGALPPQPGAHVEITRTLDSAIVRRCYSLLPSPRGIWRIAVKTVKGGRMSPGLATLRPDDTLLASGPRQSFQLQPGPDFTLLLAGGIGITALASMAFALHKVGRPFRLIHLARSSRDLVLGDILRQRLGAAYTPILTSEAGRPDPVRFLADLPQETRLYLCGPYTLQLAVRNSWISLGREDEDLVSESFMRWTGTEDCAFEVAIGDTGKIVSVPQDRNMLDALRADGIEVVSSCERGECGTCSLRLLEVGDSVIDHRDLFQTEAQKQKCDRIFPCVSRVRGGRIRIDSGRRETVLIGLPD